MAILKKNKTKKQDKKDSKKVGCWNCNQSSHVQTNSYNQKHMENKNSGRDNKYT